MDITPLMIQTATSCTKDHQLVTSQLYRCVNRQLCVCLILLRLMDIPKNGRNLTVLIQDLFVDGIKISYNGMRHHIQFFRIF